MGILIRIPKWGLRGINMDIFDVAKSFLCKEPMTPKKIQKLCYYAQAWNMALYGIPLFDDEFEAWIHGPVCSNLYHEYKGYGWRNIEKESEVPAIVLEDDSAIDIIDQIYRIYGKMDGDQLERLTHTERPWQEARIGFKPNEPSTNLIDLNVMRDFYLEEYESSQND